MLKMNYVTQDEKSKKIKSISGVIPQLDRSTCLTTDLHLFLFAFQKILKYLY